MNFCNLVGISGHKFNGKDTIGDFLHSKYGYTKVSFAEPLKKICKELFNLNNEQLYGDLKEVSDPNWFNLQPRQLLQFIGTELFRDNMSKLHSEFKKDFWIICLENKIKKLREINPQIKIVITDVRFENEVELVKKLGGMVIKVKRKLENITDIHASEIHIDNLYCDFNVENNGTKEELYDKVTKLFEQYSKNITGNSL